MVDPASNQANVYSKKIGIIGGMGPLASIYFVQNLYSFQSKKSDNFQEQNQSSIYLFSDPKVPNRTDLLSSDHGIKKLRKFLIKSIKKVNRIGIDYIIVLCFTAHYILHSLNLPSKNKIVSLVDMMLAKIIEQNEKVLLLATRGAIDNQVFSLSKYWSDAKDFIIVPSERDVSSIHEMIYEIKNKAVDRNVFKKISRLLEKYKTSAWMAGCTELHLVNSHSEYKAYLEDYKCIDPLMMAAQDISIIESYILK